MLDEDFIFVILQSKTNAFKKTTIGNLNLKEEFRTIAFWFLIEKLEICNFLYSPGINCETLRDEHFAFTIDFNTNDFVTF